MFDLQYVGSYFSHWIHSKIKTNNLFSFEIRNKIMKMKEIFAIRPKKVWTKYKSQPEALTICVSEIQIWISIYGWNQYDFYDSSVCFFFFFCLLLFIVFSVKNDMQSIKNNKTKIKKNRFLFFTILFILIFLLLFCFNNFDENNDFIIWAKI